MEFPDLRTECEALRALASTNERLQRFLKEAGVCINELVDVMTSTYLDRSVLGQTGSLQTMTPPHHETPLPSHRGIHLLPLFFTLTQTITKRETHMEGTVMIPMMRTKWPTWMMMAVSMPTRKSLIMLMSGWPKNMRNMPKRYLHIRPLIRHWQEHVLTKASIQSSNVISGLVPTLGGSATIHLSCPPENTDGHIRLRQNHRGIRQFVSSAERRVTAAASARLSGQDTILMK